MRPIVTDGVAWSVGLSVTLVSPAKTAAPIEIPFGLWARMGRRNHVLDGGAEGRCHGNHFLAFYIWDARWRHLANAIEPSMCGGDAALCQITLTTCLCWLHIVFHFV